MGCCSKNVKVGLQLSKIRLDQIRLHDQRGWKNFEVCASKSQPYNEQPVKKGSVDNPERKESYKENIWLDIWLKKYLSKLLKLQFSFSLLQ